MQNLLILLYRYGGFLLFIFLESLCFYWVVQYNKKQSEIYISSANTWAGEVYKRYDQFTRFWNLTNVNDSLANENALLRSQQRNAQFETAIRKDTLEVEKDSLRQRFIYQYATVINNSTSQTNNFITINRGSNHGIKKGMGVVNANGLVGIVRAVTPNFSLIMSVLHRQTRVSVFVKSKNYLGSLIWNGLDSRYMQMEDVPKHANLAQGDTVITSGYSNIFPPSIVVGRVEVFKEKPGSGFLDVKIALNNDLNNVKYVYVIEDLFADEIKTLENSLK